MTEKIITLFLLLGSIAYLFFAQQLTFGIPMSPKSGFLPILAGFTAVAIALLLVVNQWHTKKALILKSVDWTKFIFVIIGLLFYITLFNIIGYFAATFILLFYLFKVADTTGWVVPFMGAASSSTVFFLIFKYYLAVTLP